LIEPECFGALQKCEEVGFGEVHGWGGRRVAL
jgi:hypothetical protein